MIPPGYLGFSSELPGNILYTNWIKNFPRKNTRGLRVSVQSVIFEIFPPFRLNIYFNYLYKEIKQKYNTQIEENEVINEQIRIEVDQLKATVKSLENEKRVLMKEKSMICSIRILLNQNS